MPKELTDQMYAWPLNVPETGKRMLLFSLGFSDGLPNYYGAFGHQTYPIECACAFVVRAEDVYANCFSLCTEKQSKCSDSDETTACKSCLTTCATTFDGAMLECVQGQSDTTTGTYGANLDACMNTATATMDDCRSTCSREGRSGVGPSCIWNTCALLVA